MAYCSKLCWFCACNTKIVNDYEPVTKYMKSLTKEFKMTLDYIKDVAVQQIHFGGGSPTILSAQDFNDFMQIIGESVKVNGDAEIALEIDPRTMNADKVATYKNVGINRVSIGVQDFDYEVQKKINRVQPFELVRDTIEDLRDNNIKSFNLDLIYGLPGQTLSTITKSIELTLSLSPDRIALFGYAHVPWIKKHQQLISKHELPDANERLKMFRCASNLLKEAGYIAIGLDHFAKPHDELAIALTKNKVQRNFQGYTTDENLIIGFGASAISSLKQGYNAKYQ